MPISFIQLWRSDVNDFAGLAVFHPLLQIDFDYGYVDW